ncbi:MAG: hypothetical protein II901_00965 [Paludibacteraceae bacterium]|nr:hypothetical protein [Paludibacteraceae bacterium]
MLLSDHIFSPSMRYESHRFYVNCPGDEDAFVFGGILGAALAAVSLVDTDEGNARGIRLYTDEEKEEFFARYDREVLHDDWGYLTAEIDQLHDAYVQLVVADVPLSALFPNVRLLNLALDLMMSYMHRLALEQYREHIWDLIPWTEPFAQWLWSASQVERCRQRYLQTDWSNLVEVISMVDNPEPEEGPLFVFVGEEAEDIMSRYLQWLSDEYVAMKQEIPGAKITSADRKYIYAQETDWAFLSDEIDQLDASEQKEWNRWQMEWSRFLSERLLPMKEIRFWADDVPEEIQEHLLYHLQLAEQHPAHFRDLTTAVYAMRQLGYIRRKCPDRDIRQWLSEHLKLDYTERNNASQFRRAMKEHGRYTPEVRDEVILLESMGYFRFQVPAEE